MCCHRSNHVSKLPRLILLEASFFFVILECLECLSRMRPRFNFPPKSILWPLARCPTWESSRQSPGGLVLIPLLFRKIRNDLNWIAEVHQIRPLLQSMDRRTCSATHHHRPGSLASSFFDQRDPYGRWRRLRRCFQPFDLRRHIILTCLIS